MKTLIVGAGIMGLSTAWALNKRGHKVTVVEQGPIPNPLGSSVDQHRLIRFPYGAMDGYAAMVSHAYPAWDRLWDDLGRRLYVKTGTLAVGTSGQDWLNDSAAVLEAQNHELERLPPDDLVARFPLLRGNDIDQAFYLDSGGVLLAGRIVEVLAHHLARRGVTLMPHHAATEIDPDQATVQLRDGRTLEADNLIVAAGPWVGRLLPDAASRVSASRQVLVYLKPPVDLQAGWAAMPMLLDIEPDRGFYLIPPVAGTGLKIGDHSFSMAGDPDLDREATEDEARALFALCENRLASFDQFSLDAGKTCFYTVHPPEERFIVEPAGASSWVMTGFTGHGFKFGPLMGETVADALEGHRRAEEVSRWAAGYID
ncbi:MAG: FAD-dependent oxidoreductase [Pseudomonadota bacterium]